MASFRRVREHWCVLLGLGLVLSVSQGCARSDSHRTDVTSPPSEQKLPFHPSGDQAPANDDAATFTPDAELVSALPFRVQPRILPSGTLLTVQLEDSLSSAKIHAGDAFSASVAAPIVVDGETLIARGTTVTGYVESSRVQSDGPGVAAGSGYFRLGLIEINLAGRQLGLQTSSLFARGTFQKPVVRLPRGRHLTFRLIAPVTLADPNTIANRQNPGSSSE